MGRRKKGNHRKEEKRRWIKTKGKTTKINKIDRKAKEEMEEKNTKNKR